MSAYGYRRGSIFWALTLIAVGFIFLYQNFNPTVHPWEIIAKFWPILIIFWGISKLIDHAQSRAHPETAAPPLFSGSEVILLLLILALGTLVSKIVLRPQGWAPLIHVGNDEEWANLFTNSYSYTQTLSQPVEGHPHLIFVDHRGDVEVRGSDHAAIEAVIKETIRSNDEPAARQLSDKLKFEIVQQAGQYVLKSNLDSLPNSGSNVRLDITLRVPIGTATQITAERGDVALDNLNADQTVTVNHGDLHVTQLQGLVRVHKSGGDAEIRDVKGSLEVEGHGGDVSVSGVTGTVTVNGEFSGDVQFRDVGQTLRFVSSRTDLTLQRLTGRLDMDMGSLDGNGIKGPFEITTREKDINLDGFGHSVKISDTNGDIQLRSDVPPAHPIEVSSKKGEIELAIPANSSFQIDATSAHGEVVSDFSGPNLKIVTNGDNPSITGSYGQGGPTIRLSTAYGTIRLARSGAHPPAPPNPPEAPVAPSQKTVYEEN